MLHFAGDVRPGRHPRDAALRAQIQGGADRALAEDAQHLSGVSSGHHPIGSPSKLAIGRALKELLCTYFE